MSFVVEFGAVVRGVALVAAFSEHLAEEALSFGFLWRHRELPSPLLLPLGEFAVEFIRVHVVIAHEALLNLCLGQPVDSLGENDLVAFDMCVSIVHALFHFTCCLLLYCIDQSLIQEFLLLRVDVIFHQVEGAEEVVIGATMALAEESVPAEPAVSIQTLLASADIEKGAKVFKKCSQCHVLDKGGANKIGPALWNIVNKDIGAKEDYKYSNAMAAYGGQWTYEQLNGYLLNPKKYNIYIFSNSSLNEFQ